MTARRLQKEHAVTVPKFAVVGTYHTTPGTHFVQHVSLIREETQIQGLQEVAVWHMGPPLVAGPRSSVATSQNSTCPANLIGLVELDAQDIEGLETWLAEVDKEERPPGLRDQYVVNPPMRWARAENTVRTYRQFSCVGFVLEGYRSIGINLINDGDPSQLPEVDLDTLLQIYPFAKYTRNREMFGIPGNGPWRILLAGYLFHAVDGEPHERRWPYLPKTSIERLFPLPP